MCSIIAQFSHNGNEESIDTVPFVFPRPCLTIGRERKGSKMKGEKATRILAAATVLAMVGYAGNGLYCRSRAAQATEPPEETAAQTEARTEPPTQVQTAAPETEPVEITEAIPDPELAAALEETMANMDGAYIFVYDVTAGQMLCSKTGVADKLYPASITKLYTAWLALQYLEPDTVVTAGEELALVGSGSSLAYISRGCRLSVEMLVEAMLLPSGNDAAYVLAAAAGRAIAGDPGISGRTAVDIFVAEMNRQGTALGLVNSNFTNPDGYHTGSHYSCPADLAILGTLAMESDVIRKYAGLEADAVTFASGERITWYNTNRMVNPGEDQYCPEAVGLKTGYTGEAGYCLLAAFENEQRQILVGIFGAERNLTRYENAAALWRCCGEEDQ